MPRRKVESKVNKRSSALKPKTKLKKGQQQQDEHSMVELNSRTDLHQIVRDPNVQQTSSNQSKKQNDLKILEDIGELAQKSVQKKKTLPGSRKTMNPSDLANLLSGIDDINVSKEQKNLSKQSRPAFEPKKDNNNNNNINNSASQIPPSSTQTQDLDIEV